MAQRVRKVKNLEHRTGFGFDSHLFDRKGTLVLGAHSFPGVPQLKGHSDGDAVLHAVIDALLGAAVLGDIGMLFPDTNPAYKNISSQLLLKEALQRVSKEGFNVTHVDVTIVADKPKLLPVRNQLRAHLARLLQCEIQSVSVKAKTPEGLNLFKSPGGIAVWAVASLAR